MGAAMQKMQSTGLNKCFAKCCKRCTCCHNFCSLLCTFLFIVVVAGCGQVVAELAYSNTGENGDNFEVSSYDDGSAGSYALRLIMDHIQDHIKKLNMKSKICLFEFSACFVYLDYRSVYC